MKHKHLKFIGLAGVVMGLSACVTQYEHDADGRFILGAASDQNVKAQSIRAVDIPNSNGLTGQSGERAVAAITRLNMGDQPELGDISTSDIGS